MSAPAGHDGEHWAAEAEEVGARCPHCNGDLSLAPVEPEPDTWVIDRFGTPHHRHPTGSGWGQPGLVYLGDWQAMWRRRGPLVSLPAPGGDRDQA